MSVGASFDITLFLSLLLTYCVGFFVFYCLVSYVHFMVFLDVSSKNKRKKVKTQSPNLPVKKSLYRKYIPYVRFCFTDRRHFCFGKNVIPVSRSLVYWILYVSGLVSILLFVFFSSFYLILGSFVLFSLSLFFAIISSSRIIKLRDKVSFRVAELCISHMGADKNIVREHEKNCRVTKWRDDMFIDEIEINIPTGFSPEREDAFLEQFNVVFGGNLTYVPKDSGEDSVGWNYNIGVLTLRCVPPLPQLARWDERYVLHENIPWSFFPLALGVENGIELVNENGELENVLGYDVLGKAQSLGAKNGFNVGDELVAAPMVLIAGSTGSGKALDVNTPIMVVKKDNMQEG